MFFLIKLTFLKNSLNTLFLLGVNPSMPMQFSDRIKIINKFCLLCIFYTIPYIIFSIYLKFYSSALVFLSAQLLFILSLYFNKVQKFEISKTLVVISTNFSVFYLSLFYGFSSGFHLYYFTSPLIVLSLFSFDEVKNFIMATSVYMISILVLVLFYLMNIEALVTVDSKVIDLLYSINIFLAMSFSILIAVNFSNFNKKINISLKEKNFILIENENLLVNEIMERKNTSKKLEESLSEIEILLSETHHRVKNNLAVISGMLDLQALNSEDKKLKSVLTDSRNRIKSMSLIHESLYQYNNLSQIEFSRYLETLTDEIRKTYPSIECNVELNRKLDVIHLPVSKAIPCGLLINEVLSNAYKHAFAGRTEGLIDIVFQKDGDSIILIVKDNGVGFDKGVESKNLSLGTSLIDVFSRQLKGSYTFKVDNGTIFNIKFKA